MVDLVRLLRRETSSTEFIPVIDGLRFLAILMVVFFHVNAYIQEKSQTIAFNSTESYLSANIFVYGHQGVQLFFVISGFILAMPFMRQSFGQNDKQISLKQYFLRRLTRLEPPYFVSTLVLFLVLAIFVSEKYSYNDLLASLFASLFYLNNFLFPGESPRINSVTWSLEVEIQFYLLAPFLVWCLCTVKRRVTRRLLILMLIIAFAVLSWLLETVLQIRAISLANFFQYFLAGVLVCDIYLLDSDEMRFDGFWYFFLGVFLLLFLTSVEHSQTSHLLLKIVSPLAIGTFYLIVFGNRFWKRFFSISALTVIGGMCYTIYLLHYSIISAVGRLAVANAVVPNFYSYFAIQTFIYLIAILLASFAFFLLIEKPCMRPDWYLRVFENLKTTFQHGRSKRIFDQE